ncbi:translation factor pelota [Phyllosticta capitalensis]
MRLLKNFIDRRTGAGSVTLLPEEPEDMWHAFNLIRPGDKLYAEAIRKVAKTTGGVDTGKGKSATTTKRVHTRLTIQVTKTDFDPGAAQLHVAGVVAEENEYVGLGQSHTLDLELHRQFKLEKADGWDSIAIAALEEATDARQRAEIWAVVMQEGVANICLITEHQTILRQRVQTPIPTKGKSGAGAHDKGMEKFYGLVLSTLLRHVDLNNSRPLLLASPGFTAQSFQQHIKQHAITTGDKALRNWLPSIIVTHSSSGQIHALNEVLKSKAIQEKLSNTKYARETALMDRFFELMRKDDGRAWYGPREVEKAVEKGAVGRGGGVLLISNALFRSDDIGTRRRWVSLVDRVREQEGGEVRVLSSAHESGKRLEGLGNIAAILTYPIEDIDEEVDGESGEAAAVADGEHQS